MGADSLKFSKNTSIMVSSSLSLLESMNLTFFYFGHVLNNGDGD